MWAHGRQGKQLGYGSANMNSKLVEYQVADIRKRHEAGGITYAALAREFSVDKGVIEDICKRISWKHVT